jgi:hypothetical protein
MKLHYAPLSSIKLQRSSHKMELPGLANLKRKTLRGIASLTERPSKNMAERSEAKTPGAGFPRPKGQAAEDGGAGTTPSEIAAAASGQSRVVTSKLRR